MEKLLFYLVFFCPIFCYAQIDTEFWFAAPEVSDNYLDYDEPILLFLSSQDRTAIVTIKQPANELFTPIVIALPPNTTQKVDLSPYIGTLENQFPDQVSNFGLLIQSTEPISAYYEVASLNCYCNPEIFVLKGQNALGLDFFVPFQTYWSNHPGYTPTPFGAFDIVATADETRVTITPSQAIVGHPAGTSFSIILNAGETYSAKAASQQAVLHPAGSRVQANKPIAITMKDDLLYSDNYGPCRDLLGDQIIPTSVIGTEYIVVKGFLNNQDKVFVLGTEPNTSLTVNGAMIGTINAGQTMDFDLMATSMLVESSAPVYVLHVSGFGCEVGAAVLPPLDCTGSQSISFTRSTDEFFGLAIVVKNGAQDQFSLNGVPLNSSTFSPVAGTGGEWVMSRQSFSTAEIPVGTASVISNSDEVFQMAVINGGETTGCRYGYFSSFNELQVDLGGDQVWCEGSSLVLSSNVRLNGVNWLWQDGSTETEYEVQAPGTYAVIGQKGNCVGADTIEVSLEPTPFFELPPDTMLCVGDALILSPQVEGNLEWQDGSTEPSYLISNSGWYWLEARNGECSYRDSIFVEFLEVPFVDLGRDTVICAGIPVELDATVPVGAYLWADGSEEAIRTVSTDGVYSVTVTNNCGIWTDSKRIVTKACIKDCQVLGPNAFSPNGDGFNDEFSLYPPACQVMEWHLRIFDRWGGMVFETINPEIGWNGKVDGSAAGIGVYIWLLEASVQNGFDEIQSIRESGDLTLIR